MKNKKAIALLLAIAMIACLCLSGCGSTASPSTASPSNTSSAPAESTTDAAPEDKPVTLKFAIYLASGSRYETSVVQPFVDLVEERSNGSITFELYTGATLCAPDAVLDTVKDGLADIGWLYTGNYTGALPLTFLMEYPTYFASARAASYTLRDYLTELQPAELDGTHLLMAFCSGEGILINNKKEIRTPDDVKGLEIRVNGIMGDVITAFGGTPVAMVASEAYEAIRSGVVDGYMATPDSVNNFKLFEVTNFATRVHFCNTTHLTLMNEAVYDKLSDNQKKILDECAEEILSRVAAAGLNSLRPPFTRSSLKAAALSLTSPRRRSRHSSISSVISSPITRQSLTSRGLKAPSS
jgi:TRAP-type C4-dicarboxylate transport system substrate-binding protein